MEQSCPLLPARFRDRCKPERGPYFTQLEVAIQQCARGAWAAGGAATVHHWLTGLMMRMAATHTGIGLRQAQRQFKRQAGQSQRELQLYAQTERAFAFIPAAGEPDLSAEVALQAGYSDQSHFGREVKRVSGFSPAQFAQSMKTDGLSGCIVCWGRPEATDIKKPIQKNGPWLAQAALTM